MFIVMREIEERYISLLTDFGFKRIFGTAPNKDSLKTFRDLKNSLDTAEEKGRTEGIEIGVLRMAKRMKDKGYSISDIIEMTDLSEDEISQL